MRRLFRLLAGAKEEVGSDLGEAARKREPRSFFTHLAALTLSKTADGLVDPKLVLSGLMSLLGAPAGFVGLLVPVREAGALLPQIALSGLIAARERRKWIWAAGALGQGFAALSILGFALFSEGTIAGTGIVASLAVLAVARSACSASYKDILGRTVDIARRGRTTGLAASIASGIVILFGLALTLGDRSQGLLTLMVGLAAAAWLVSGPIMASLPETPADAQERPDSIADFLRQLGPAFAEPQFRTFIATRALLSATAFAPPFLMLTLGGDADNAQGVGLLVLAAALAGLVSAYVWGWLSDRSSRAVLMAAAALGGAALLAAALLSGSGVWSPMVAAVNLFILMLAYRGVRLGRSTHLIDMASEQVRAYQTALSNTIMGVVLAAGGIFGAIAQVFGVPVTLAVLGLMSLAAIIPARMLREVQEG